MLIENHYINGKLVNLPRNYRGAKINVDFRAERTELNISIGSYTWQRQEAQALYQVYENGLLGGDGVDKGVPHRIEISNNGQTTTIFDGYIDLQNAEFDPVYWTVEANSVKRRSIDFINERAQGVDFRTLFEEGVFTSNDFVFVPYVLRIEGYGEVAVASLTVAFVTQELVNLTSNMVIPETVESATVIDTVGGVIRLVASIVYAAILFTIIVKTILDIYNNLVQNIKYKAAMRVSKLLSIGATQLGLTFKSDILSQNGWKDLVIIPPSYFNPFQSGIADKVRGFFNQNPSQQFGFYQGNYGQFLNDIIPLFNARLTFSGSQMRFEPKSLLNPVANFRIPKVDQNRFTTNAKERPATVELSFIAEPTDSTLQDNFLGTSYQETRVGTSNADPDLNLRNGFKLVSLNFSRVKRKTNLTLIEDILDTLFNVISPLISGVIKVYNAVSSIIKNAVNLLSTLIKALKLIGVNVPFAAPKVPELKSPNLKNLISNRIGIMELPSDIIGTHKLAIIDPNNSNKLSVLHEPYLNAKYIFKAFYRTEFEQKIIKRFVNIPVNYTDFNTIINDGYVYTPTGKIAEVLEFNWDKDKLIAEFTVAELSLFLNGEKIVAYEQR